MKHRHKFMGIAVITAVIIALAFTACNNNNDWDDGGSQDDWGGGNTIGFVRMTIPAPRYTDPVTTSGITGVSVGQFTEAKDFDIISAQWSTENNTFQAGTEYTISVKLAVKEGFQFSQFHMHLEVNWLDNFQYIWQSVTAVINSAGTELTFSFTFPSLVT